MNEKSTNLPVYLPYPIQEKDISNILTESLIDDLRSKESGVTELIKNWAADIRIIMPEAKLQYTFSVNGAPDSLSINIIVYPAT